MERSTTRVFIPVGLEAGVAFLYKPEFTNHQRLMSVQYNAVMEQMF
jgi:hypothetical protein